MKRGFVLFGLLILVLSVVYAIEIGGKDVEVSSIDCSYLESYEAEVLGEQIPKEVPFQDEILNIYLEESFFLGLTVERGNLTDLNCEPYEENTYDLRVKDVGVLLSGFQVEGAKPLDVILENLSNGNVEITGKTFGKKVKWFFATLGLKIASWFI